MAPVWILVKQFIKQKKGREHNCTYILQVKAKGMLWHDSWHSPSGSVVSRPLTSVHLVVLQKFFGAEMAATDINMRNKLRNVEC